MGPVGLPEMFAIFVIALLLFGPKKLPELGRTLGKALSEFRRAKNELKSTFETHLQELERETRISTTSSASTSDYSSGYSYPYEDYNQYDSASPDYSNPSKIAGTEELRAALPPSSGEISPTPEQSVPEHGMPSWPPVSGAVARTNGIRPLDESIEQEHAPAQEEHPV